MAKRYIQFFSKKERRYCLNPHCKKYFVIPPSDKQRYCSQSCWYLVRRDYKSKTSPPCPACGKLITQKGASKFCSINCQARNNYNQYILRWKQGLENGNRGIIAKNLSQHKREWQRMENNLSKTELIKSM